MKRLASWCCVLPCFLILGPHAFTQGKSQLAGNTVLIVRHAEKPLKGPDLSEQGYTRAQRYVTFFEPFQQDGYDVRVDALYAGADSENSARPRETLEPLSKASGIPLDLTVGTKDPEKLVHLLTASSHRSHPLVSWRHVRSRPCSRPSAPLRRHCCRAALGRTRSSTGSSS